MTVEEALAAIETILGRSLGNELQEQILRAAWEQRTYPEMAESLGYDADYIKLVGFQLWKMLSEALGVKVTKHNFRVLLKQLRPPVRSQLPPTDPVIQPSYQDWGEAIDVSVFYGRQSELTQLTEWIGSGCRLVAILGMGGTGKTALSVKLAEQLHSQFDLVIWRSLHNAPDLSTLLNHLQWPELPDGEPPAESSPSQPGDADPVADSLSANLHQQITKLLMRFRQHRCLLILDNVETILTSPSEVGGRVGHYRPGFEPYGELFRKIGELKHQSCLVLTSREKPKEVAALAGDRLPVRSLQLKGLPLNDGRAIVQAKGPFCGSETDWQQLIHTYAGNPLALKIVSTTIDELFGGQIAPFLAQGALIFGDIQDLLAQQINRLSDLEHQILVWLAINREPIAIAELQSDLLDPGLPTELLAALDALQRRSLMERSGQRFTLQPVLMEYLIDRLIQQVCRELEAIAVDPSVTQPTSPAVADFNDFNRYALIKAESQDYVRETQIRLILNPILDRLGRRWGAARLETLLLHGLAGLRQQSIAPGYAGGNLLNLLAQLKLDWSGYDFSQLTLWQADLRNLTLRQTNFAGSDLSKASFTERFNHIYAMAVSPDGQWLCTADTQGEISLWRLSSGELVQSWEAHAGSVRSLIFLPDSQTIASGGDDQLLKLWDRQGKCQRQIHNPDGTVWALSASPDGQTIAFTDGTIKLWSLHCDRPTVLSPQVDWTTNLRFSPDGQILAASCNSGVIKLWRLQTVEGSVQAFIPDPVTLPGHQRMPLVFLCFSPDGQLLLSGGLDNQLYWWEVSTGRCLHSQSHQGWVWWVDCSPDGQTIASCSADQTIRLWDRQTGQLVRTLRGHESGVRVVLFTQDGHLISSDESQTLKHWNWQSGQCLKTWRGYSDSIWAIAFSSDGRTLVSSGEEQTAKLWDVATGQCRKHLKGHWVWVRSVAFSPDDQTVATAGVDGLVRLWQAQTGDCLRVMQGHLGFVWSVTYSPDGQTLATCSVDYTIRLWQVSTGECLRILDHASPVIAVIYSPDGQRLASYGVDQTVRLWDAQTGDCLQVLRIHSEWHFSATFDWGGAIAFHPAGHLLASNRETGSIQFWDLSTGEPLGQIAAHSGPIVAIAYHPDGQRLVSASMDGQIKVWDTQTGTCLRLLTGHAKWVHSLAFTVLPDCDPSTAKPILASSSGDRTIRFWDLETGDCLKLIKSDLPYEGMNITAVRGVSAMQRSTLLALGALEQ